MERDQILKQCCQMFGGEKAQKTFLDPDMKTLQCGDDNEIPSSVFFKVFDPYFIAL